MLSTSGQDVRSRQRHCPNAKSVFRPLREKMAGEMKVCYPAYQAHGPVGLKNVKGGLERT